MITPNTPTSRMAGIRRTRWWPPVAYYGGLIKASPRLVSKAATDVERWVSVVVLVAAVVGATVSLREREYQLAGLIILLVVILGFLRLNYQEIEKRDAETREMRQRVFAYQQEQLFDPFHYRMIDDLLTFQMYGYTEIVRKLDRGEGTFEELTAAFDGWDANVAQHLSLIDEKEIEFLRRPVESALREDDWRDRLRALLEIRKTRIEAIHVRQKMRYDAKVAERKKKDGQAKAART